MHTQWIKAARIIQEGIVGPVVLCRVSKGFLSSYLFLLNREHAEDNFSLWELELLCPTGSLFASTAAITSDFLCPHILWLLGITCLSVSPGVTEVRTQQGALGTLLSVQFGNHQTCLVILNLVEDCLKCFSCCSGWLWWIIYQGCLSPQ